MRLYLAGPMRNIPLFNFPLFDTASALLRSLGHDVFSPADQDRKRHGGVDISKGNATGDLVQLEAEHKFSARDAIMDDLTFIAREAEGITILPGWEYSSGVDVERALGKFLKLPFYYLWVNNGVLWVPDELRVS